MLKASRTVFTAAGKGHGASWPLTVTRDVRAHLLSVNPVTVDHMLRPERENIRRSISSTTRRGNLLKHQIQVRTFADWDDVTSGFLEADLVAHCGGNTNGAFLNTLVLVDISGMVRMHAIVTKMRQ